MFVQHFFAHVDAVHHPLRLEVAPRESEPHRGIGLPAELPGPVVVLPSLHVVLLPLAHLPDELPGFGAAPVVLEALVAQLDGVVVLLPLHFDVRHHEPRPFKLVSLGRDVRHLLHPLQLIPRLGNLPEEHVTRAHREHRRDVVRVLDDQVTEDVQRLGDGVVILAHHPRVALEYGVPWFLPLVRVQFREE